MFHSAVCKQRTEQTNCDYIAGERYHFLLILRHQIFNKRVTDLILQVPVYYCLSGKAQSTSEICRDLEEGKDFSYDSLDSKDFYSEIQPTSWGNYLLNSLFPDQLHSKYQ